MKRDLDLIRLLLIRAEELPAGPWALDEVIEIPGYEADMVGGHIQLLQDEGLVQASDWSSQGHIDWRIERLTNVGHDFLASMRDDTIWKQAKAKFGPALGTVALKAVGDVIGQIAKDLLLGRIK